MRRCAARMMIRYFDRYRAGISIRPKCIASSRRRRNEPSCRARSRPIGSDMPTHRIASIAALRSISSRRRSAMRPSRLQAATSTPGPTTARRGTLIRYDNGGGGSWASPAIQRDAGLLPWAGVFLCPLATVGGDSPLCNPDPLWTPALFAEAGVSRWAKAAGPISENDDSKQHCQYRLLHYGSPINSTRSRPVPSRYSGCDSAEFTQFLCQPG